MLRRLIMNMDGHVHTIISLTTIGPVGQELIANGYTVHALRINLITALPAMLQLWRLFRRFRPDVIQTWMYHADLFGGLLGRLAGIHNIVWNVRNTEIPQSHLSSTGFVIQFCAALSRFIPRTVICCAHSGLERHAALGYDRKRMFVIPNGYDLSDWKPPTQTKSEIRSHYRFPVDAFIVGIVGRFDPLKGYDIFVEAAGLMASKCNRNLLFLMIGRGVDDENIELRSMMLTKGKKAHFKLMSERNDIARLMYTLDVFCLSSRAEGFPNVVAEAMLMQVPCVVTDVGDASQIVGKTGIVVPAGHPHALADALLVLEHMDQQQRQIMGFAARERIEDNYAIQQVSKQYERLYQWKQHHSKT